MAKRGGLLSAHLLDRVGVRKTQSGIKLRLRASEYRKSSAHFCKRCSLGQADTSEVPFNPGLLQVHLFLYECYSVFGCLILYIVRISMCDNELYTVL